MSKLSAIRGEMARLRTEARPIKAEYGHGKPMSPGVLDRAERMARRYDVLALSESVITFFGERKLWQLSN